ncbi:MAG: pyruvate dehydrogenase (acetyl-transferring) E1 component subunit alpha [Dehalococcoidia bacterium]|nr:pyruvate dehydrogenase (acetyl-transferring) E1 component subunit alpha [Dehalococcoidia bacterium]
MAKVAERTARQTDLVGALKMMMLIRRFEERAAEAYARSKIKGFLHLYIGQEAVAVGAVGALRPNDYVISHYREHGHILARGSDPGAVMAELYGKQTGVTGGRGGSMHLFDVERRFMGGYAIVAGHLPTACGLAIACQARGEGDLVLCIFGDGAVNEGEFHEALNLAAVWKLPVLFLCENNLYGMGTAVERVSAVEEVYKRARAYEIPSDRVDGMDYFRVREAVLNASEQIRAGQGPYFLEALTFRYRGHSMADAELYRDKDEVTEWRARDAIEGMRRELDESGVLGEGEFDRLQSEVDDEVERAAAFAEESPEPPLESLHQKVYAD